MLSTPEEKPLYGIPMFVVCSILDIVDHLMQCRKSAKPVCAKEVFNREEMCLSVINSSNKAFERLVC